MRAPTSLLQHAQMSENDKKFGMSLLKVNTWEVIDETQYQAVLKNQVKHTLPTMPIVINKKDGDGLPVRAKYCIVALGKLDPHLWTKQDCFVPVLSQPKLHLLLALAVRNKRFLQSGDISQAFCQSFLPRMKSMYVNPQQDSHLLVMINIGF